MKKSQPKKQSSPRPTLALIPKDTDTEHFPYGKKALGQRADLPFTFGS